jgi:ketosteroid isomerase-like protein
MTSTQKMTIEAIAARVNQGALDGLEEFFTEDFLLHDPNGPDWPRGRAGARKMMAAFHGIKIAPLDMVEQGDRVCVRWSFSGMRDGAPISASCVAIYRFENGLIAEDWGVTTGKPWP